MSLRNKLIRLAHSNPELRVHILPLLENSRTASRYGFYAEILVGGVPKGWKIKNIVDQGQGAVQVEIQKVIKTKSGMPVEYMILLDYDLDRDTVQLYFQRQADVDGYSDTEHHAVVENMSRYSINDLKSAIKNKIETEMSGFHRQVDK